MVGRRKRRVQNGKSSVSIDHLLSYWRARVLHFVFTLTFVQQTETRSIYNDNLALIFLRSGGYGAKKQSQRWITYRSTAEIFCKIQENPNLQVMKTSQEKPKPAILGCFTSVSSEPPMNIILNIKAFYRRSGSCRCVLKTNHWGGTPSAQGLQLEPSKPNSERHQI